MITTKRSSFELKKNGKKIILPKNIRQYNCTEKEYRNFSKKEKDIHLYSYKFYGIEYRKMLVELLSKRYDFNEHELSLLATYLIDCYKDALILTNYKNNQIAKYEIPFSKFVDQDFPEEEDVLFIIDEKKEIKYQYSEKQTKLYKLSQISYTPSKSSWVTANTNNVFEFNGVSYIINKDNKNYKCDAQNTSKMDRVFCAYTNDGIEFYDMNIDKIDAQLLQ